MKIKNLFNKIFKRHPQTTSNGIASFSNLSVLPTREEFTSSPENLNLLETIKEQYSKIIYSKRTILSLDLNIGDLREEMNMYIELLFNQLEPEDEKNFSFKKASEEDPCKKEIDFIIKMAKLKSYYFSIEYLNSQTIARIIALKEILAESSFLSPFKKRSIQEEINGLSSCLFTFQNQRVAISVELQYYLRQFETPDIDIELTAEDDLKQQILNQKNAKLISMLTILLPQESYSNPAENQYLNLALLEETIEKHIYKHKSDIDSLRAELTNLFDYINWANNPKKYLSKILELEIKFIAFATYGHKLVTEKDITTLYDLKFKCLTANIYSEEKLDIAGNANFTELECYQEIISRKISNLLQGKTNRLVSQIPDLLKYVIKILRNDSKEYSFWDIIADKEKLGFLLAFEQNDNLREFFDKTRASASDIQDANLPKDSIQLENPPFLSTLFMIMSLAKFFSVNPYYEIYQKTYNYMRPKHYEIPEGVIGIDVTKNQEILKQFIDKIREAYQNNTLLTPLSLKYLKGRIFNDAYFEVVDLNEGLEQISDNVFKNARVNLLRIPATLREVDDTAFANTSVNSLRINDYQQSSLTRKSIENLIKCLFAMSKTDILTPVENQSSKTKLYSEYEDVNRTYEVYPTFKELILEDGNQEIIILPSDLVFTVQREERIFHDKSIRRKERYHDYQLTFSEASAVYEQLIAKLERILRKAQKNIEKDKTSKKIKKKC